MGRQESRPVADRGDIDNVMRRVVPLQGLGRARRVEQGLRLSLCYTRIEARRLKQQRD